MLGRLLASTLPSLRSKVRERTAGSRAPEGKSASAGPNVPPGREAMRGRSCAKMVACTRVLAVDGGAATSTRVLWCVLKMRGRRKDTAPAPRIMSAMESRPVRLMSPSPNAEDITRMGYRQGGLEPEDCRAHA
jgi:hypothetical protein